MKKYCGLFILVSFLCEFSFSQIGINTEEPNPHAALHIVAKGNAMGFVLADWHTSAMYSVNSTLSNCPPDGFTVYDSVNQRISYLAKSDNSVPPNNGDDETCGEWIALCDDATLENTMSNLYTSLNSLENQISNLHQDVDYWTEPVPWQYVCDDGSGSVDFAPGWGDAPNACPIMFKKDVFGNIYMFSDYFREDRNSGNPNSGLMFTLPSDFQPVIEQIGLIYASSKIGTYHSWKRLLINEQYQVYIKDNGIINSSQYDTYIIPLQRHRYK